MTTTPVIGIPTLDAAEANKVEQVNRALRHIEAVHLGRIESRTLTAPPGSPADGVKYIVGASATGDWSGQDGKLAYQRNGTWVFQAVVDGMMAWIHGDKALMCFADSEWFPAGGDYHSATEHWTGRYRGSAKVYARTYSGIVLPNSGTTNTAHGIVGIDLSPGQEPRWRGTATFTSGATIPIPAVNTLFNVADIFVDSTNIVIQTNYSASILTARVDLEYCYA